MSNDSSKKESLNDLKALFMPDILQSVDLDDTLVKKEDNDPMQEISRLIGQTNKNAYSDNEGVMDNSNNHNDEGFMNFMDNNSFISTIPQNHGEMFLNHYSGFIPEAASMHPHLSQQRFYGQMNPYMQLFPSSNLPNPHKNSHISNQSNELVWGNFGSPASILHERNLDNPLKNSVEASNNPTRSSSTYLNVLAQDAEAPSRTAPRERSPEIHMINLSGGNMKTKKSTAKSKKLAPSTAKLSINYPAHKLNSLLDLKKVGPEQSSFKIIDKEGNDVKVRFSSFLNGRFFTNDVDNSNYYMMKLGGDDKDAEKTIELEKNQSKDDFPMVLSCYRRNYIQVSINFNISGMSSTNGNVLSLLTSEYGFSVTRVIKWFKIEIYANTNVSTLRSVPIVIYEDNKDKSKEELESSNSADTVHPIYFDKLLNIITVSGSTLQKNEVDNYYVVKKLQFKNATPNNGNTNFQNYYNLKIRLSAVVADLYYDDYMDEDFQEASNDNEKNEITICELSSEPIIVRGRNPSFYAERKDILLKGRNASSKQSFKDSERYDVSVDSDFDFSKDSSTFTNDVNANVVNSLAATAQNLDSNKSDTANSHNDEKTQGGVAKDSYEITHEHEESSDNESNKDILFPHSLDYDHKNEKIPPVVYNAAISNSINIKSMLKDSNELPNMKSISKSGSRYKYFPISSIYYLPPINVVYFPHSAHQINNNTTEPTNAESPCSEDATTTLRNRKNSNVYFK